MSKTHATLDAVIPIVFPNYMIKVSEALEIPSIDLPSFKFLGKTFGGKTEKVTVFDGKISDLGHAGVLVIRGGAVGARGLTKYYEYGRYDKEEKGIVRRVRVDDVKLGSDGRATKESLTAVLATICQKAGHGSRIAAVYMEVPGKFNDIQAAADFRESLNAQPIRQEYAVLSYSCLHFMRDTVAKGGRVMPSIIDPTPSAYIERVRDAYPDLDYDPKSRQLKIEAANDVPIWAQTGASGSIKPNVSKPVGAPTKSVKHKPAHAKH